MVWVMNKSQGHYGYLLTAWRKKVLSDICILNKFIYIMRYTASKLEKSLVMEANSNEIQYRKKPATSKAISLSISFT